MNNVYDKGSNGLIINGHVQFIIETKKVPNAPDWLYNAAKRYGIQGYDCEGVLENNPDRHIHHLCHAYAAYYQSGFSNASILVIDGMNRPDGISIGIFQAEHDSIKEIKTYPVSYSLGSWYSLGVALCGWGDNDYAGKLMGASAYAYNSINKVEPFFIVDPDTGDVMLSGGQFYATGMEHYDEKTSTGHILEFTNKDYLKRLSYPNNNIPPNGFNFTCIRTAGTIQYQFEQSVFSLLEYMYRNLPSRNLVLTGGCALNCVCNGKIIRSRKWDDVFIPNMCEDTGNIIGRMVMELNQKVDKPYIYNRVTYPVPKEWNKTISESELADKIRQGTIVLWFEGGSEYGPRALCHRSILADPTLPWMAYRINEIKGRESWRPLAPVVLSSHFKTFFDVDGRVWHPHKTMLVTEYIRPEYQRKLQAVCAPDNSSRPQVLLDFPENHTLYSLMNYYELPILVNTSMNGAGEPICETPEDAIRFASRHKDVLLVFVKNDKIYVRE